MNPHLSIVSLPANEVPAEAHSQHTVRQIAGGISLVTSAEDGKLAGAVITSLSALPTNPPTLVVGLRADAPVWPAISRQRVFGINLLGIRHFALAKRFAGAREETPFNKEEWLDLDHGPPILKDAIAAFECDLVESVEHDAHVLLIGRARKASGTSGSDPLLHWQGRFHTLAATHDDWTPLVAPKAACSG